MPQLPTRWSPGGTLRVVGRLFGRGSRRPGEAAVPARGACTCPAEMVISAQWTPRHPPVALRKNLLEACVKRPVGEGGLRAGRKRPPSAPAGEPTLGKPESATVRTARRVHYRLDCGLLACQRGAIHWPDAGQASPLGRRADMTSPDYRTFVDTLIPGHEAWLAAHPAPSGNEFLDHYVGDVAHSDGLLWMYEAWRAEHGYTRIRPWNGTEALGWTGPAEIPSPGRVLPWLTPTAPPAPEPAGPSLADSFLADGTSTASLQTHFGVGNTNALGGAILTHWNSVRTFGGDIEINVEGTAPYSIRFWGFMKWASTLRNRLLGIPVFPIPIVWDADGVPLSDIEYMDTANRWHTIWHGGAPPCGQVTSDATNNPFAPGQSPFGQFCSRFGLACEFLKFHRDLLDTYDQWRRRAGNPPVHRWRDYQWEVRQPRLDSLRSIDSTGADLPGALTVVRPAAPNPDLVQPNNALTGATPDGRGSLWIRYRVRPETWGRPIDLTVTAQVFRNSPDLAPVAGLDATTISLNGVAQGADSAATEIQFLGLDADGEAAFAHQAFPGGGTGFKNGRIRITARLVPVGNIPTSFAAGNDQFDYEQHLDVILVKEPTAPQVSLLLNKSSFSVDEIVVNADGNPQSLFANAFLVVVQDPTEPPPALAASAIFADPARTTVSGIFADPSV